MKIARLSIDRKITFYMLYLIIIGFGLFSLTQLKIDLFPDIKFPVIGVITQYRGVGPADIENLITRPLEESISATRNVKKVSSQSSQGFSIILLEFDWGTDIDQAEFDVRKRIDLVRDFLPEEATEPLVFPFDPSLQPVMFMAVSSPFLGPAEIRKLSDEQIEPLLERVEGVASANSLGGLERQINVKINPILLASHQLSVNDVVQAIGLQTSLQPAGRIETATTNFSLRTLSEYYSVKEVENVIIKMEKNVPVYVKDVAEVEDGFKERFGDVRSNFNPGVVLQINKQSDANTVLTCRRVNRALPQIEAVLPENTHIGVVYDASEFIMRSMNNLRNTAFQAFFLSFIVLLFFLRNIRGSVIMAVSIPTSVVATFAVMQMADLTLNIVSMAGLALAIGMLVDNSIVVLESVFRHHEMGKSLYESADIGTTEVGMAITASTLTTISVFVPVLFVPGIAGELFSDMVVVICFSLAASLLISLTLVPLLFSQFMSAGRFAATGHFKHLKGWVDRFLENLLATYSRFLRWSLQNRKWVLISVFVLFCLAVMMMASLGGEFLPKTDQNLVIVRINREIGTPLEKTEQTVLQLEEIVKQEVPEAENVYIIYGAGEGIAALFTGTGSNSIFLRIRLTPMEKRKRSQFQIEDRIRERLKEIPGISYEFIQPGAFSTERAIEVKVLGNDLTRGKLIAEEIKRKMENVPGLVDVSLNVKEGSPELQIIPDRERLNDLKLSVFQIASVVSTAIQGRVAALYREEGDEYNIYVQFDKKFRADKEVLQNIQIPLWNGKLIPLSRVASIREEIAPTTIYRENQERVVSVGCELSGIDLSKAVRTIQQIIRETPIPSDFQVVIGGSAEDQRESYRNLSLAFIAAILLVYMVMASQFESLLDPFIIFFTVPLAIIGVAIILFLTRTPISVMSLVGLVMLVGIVVNNGIVLVDYTNQLRRQGMELYQAAQEAGQVRLRPVLMTALTTILGMVPLALELGAGSENWSPMARAVIGGLSSSTLFTLIVVPVLYTLFQEMGEKLRSWFGGGSRMSEKT